MDKKQNNHVENQSGTEAGVASSEPPDLLEKMKTRLKELASNSKKVERKLVKRLKGFFVRTKDEVTKPGKEDPRRMIHSFKVGLALTLASLLYLLDPAFHGIGKHSIWAIITVIVVLQFTAGATLYKGINRVFGTLAAIVLSFIVEMIARNTHRVASALSIAISIFVVSSTATYSRFITSLKTNYDYGVFALVLTFNLILASSYRDETIWNMMFQRIYTIAIGFGICLLVSIFIFPIWSGEDLQNSIVKKFETLAGLVQAHVKEYFQEYNGKEEGDKPPKDSSLEKKYQDILDTSKDKSLATFASWEPRHSRYCYPWQQYMHLISVLHHFGHNVFALHGCLESQIQAPQSVRALFKEPCEHVAEEVVKVLCELADAIRNHHHCSPHLSDHLHEALQDLNSSLKSQPRIFLTSKTIPETEVYKPLETPLVWQTKRQTLEEAKDPNTKIMVNRTRSKTAITCLEFSEALPFAAFATLLVETAARLDLLINQVEELGRAAHYQEFHEEPDIKILVTCENADSKENPETVAKAKEDLQIHPEPQNHG